MSNLTFSDYFNTQALRDRLPFNIDFEMTQVSSEVTETVAGLEFRILEDLVSRESWFFNAIEDINSGNTQEATLILRSLSMKLQDILKLDTLEEAVDILWNGDTSTKNSKAYAKFHKDNDTQIQELTELLKLSQDTTALNWMRVTFFILSRVTSDWSLSHTVGLTAKQIDAILALITKEANGGVMPESASDTEDSEIIETDGKK